ncbi:MAG: glycosyltransferase family 2 protein [Actinomyces sp.]|uniref:glycosyltransferase family 2 protein n=1 Tax=Actinomyces sp. TaxID=29317 RepID=UPI0026DCE908|nr:glycosyltransferase family 2 protein [Actinomyces sp.]MDO4243473.1 glycosyltransferase family 2 protein [Actinomyces sp.]
MAPAPTAASAAHRRPGDLGPEGEAAPRTEVEAALLSRTVVVVVSYGSAELLGRNLAAVGRAAPEALIVVVENDPEPDAGARTADLCRRQGWELVRPGTNTGFGGGMNRGVARAHDEGRDLLVLLNPDAVIAREDLLRLVARADAEPLSLVAPVLRSSQGVVVADRAVVCLADGSMRSPRSRRPVPPGGTRPWLSGACLALSSTLFEAVEGFDARYFLYWEDVDFSWRVLRAGGRLVALPDATAVHDEGGTHNVSGSRAKSLTYYYYNIRNRLLLAALWLEPAEQRRWAASSVSTAREVVLRGGRRQLLGSSAPVRTAAAAIYDGLRLARAARRGTLPGPEVPLPR